MAPIAWTPAAQARKVACRSFYLDLALLEDYWVRRKYHHTLSSTMIYALREALIAVEEEGLEARWARHERHHQALARGLAAIGVDLLPPAARAALDAERRARARRHRRSEGPAAPAPRIQHRDRRGTRSAGGQDLARRADGRQLDAGAAAAVPGRARAHPSRDGPQVGGRFRGRGHGGAGGRCRSGGRA